jgi:hypothetical protein
MKTLLQLAMLLDCEEFQALLLYSLTLACIQKGRRSELMRRVADYRSQIYKFTNL